MNIQDFEKELSRFSETIDLYKKDLSGIMDDGVIDQKERYRLDDLSGSISAIAERLSGLAKEMKRLAALK